MRFPAVLATIAALLASPLASAQPSAPPAASADALVQQAMKDYQGGRLAEALDGFRRAYALSPDPSYLFSMAKIEIKLDDCASAVQHLQQYLATRPGAKATQAAQADIDGCRQKLGAAAPAAGSPGAPVAPGAPAAAGSSVTSPGPTPAEPAPVPREAEPSTLPAQPPPAEPLRPAPPRSASESGGSAWYTDALGDVLAGVGVIGLAAGGGLHLAARSASRDAEKAPGLEEYERRRGRADSLNTAGIVAASLGGALLVGGVIRYVTRGDSGEEVQRVGLVPVDGGWTLAFGGQF